MDQDFSLLDPRFTDPVAAAEYLEGIRWADGVVCPKCGESEREPYRLKGKSSTRRLWKCRACRKQFTVTVGTIFESSHVPLNKWLAAFYLLCASKKGHERAPAPPDARRDLQDRVVHVPSHP